jgi:hypothetical protein
MARNNVKVSVQCDGGGDHRRCVTSGAVSAGRNSETAIGGGDRRLQEAAIGDFMRRRVTSGGLPYLRAHTGNRIMFG